MVVPNIQLMEEWGPVYLDPCVLSQHLHLILENVKQQLEPVAVMYCLKMNSIIKASVTLSTMLIP